MKLPIASALMGAVALLLASGVHANEFVGDLVYCDENANGVYEPLLGDYPLNDVRLELVCQRVEPDGGVADCGDPQSTLTGQPPSDEELAIFVDPLNCGPVIDYDPFTDFAGRYILRVPDCTVAGETDTILCRVAVDPATVPSDCNVLVTPRADGPPFDVGGDGAFCEGDGPFPEGQLLGNLPLAGGCEEFPDGAPGDASYNPIIRFVGGDRCSVPNDFGYTPGDDPDCSIAVDKFCSVEVASDDFDCKDAKPITSLTMIWDGSGITTVTTEGGEVFPGVIPGEAITFSTAGLGNDVEVSMSGFGSSQFHVSCSDDEMDGPEDCGTAQGNGKNNSSGENLWLLEGIGGDQTLDCSPTDVSDATNECTVVASNDGGKKKKAKKSKSKDKKKDKKAKKSKSKSKQKAAGGGASGNVKYTYVIRNTGSSPVFDVVAFDDVLDRQVDGSPILSLLPTESAMLMETVEVTETVTNTVFVSAETAEGALCEAEASATVTVEVPPASCADGKPTSLAFLYTGGAPCPGMNTQDKDSCSGSTGGGIVAITILKDADDITASAALVSDGETVSFSANDGGRLPSNLRLQVGGQTLNIHTSCSDDLIVGQSFGSLTLVEFVAVP